MIQRKLVAISKGLPQTKSFNGVEYQSGIWKEPATELWVRSARIDGDDVANPKYHGGPDRVVCLYPHEHYGYWEKELGQPLSQSAFGENLTVSGMREDQVCIGDVYQIGDAVLQVSQGRYPCATINKRNNNTLLLKKIIETGYTGYFFRVLQEGKITPDSAIVQVAAQPKQITVAAIHHLYFHEKSPDRELVRRMLDVEELAEPWRKLLLGKLEQ